MAKNQKATSGKGKNGTTATKNQKEEFSMKNVNMEELVSMITKSVIATLQESKATPKKATPKKTQKTVTDKVNPVKEKIEKEQEELKVQLNGKEYGSQTSGDFVAFYRRKDNGSYTRIGHFNKVKGLFWYTKKSVTFKDWAYIKAQLIKYSNVADFARNEARFARAGIKCPSDFAKVSWETFLTSGVFC